MDIPVRWSDAAGPIHQPVIVGDSESIRSIKQKILRVSDKDITVLISGETGVGKDLLAHFIHCHSSRNRRPMIKIACGSLPDELMESEIFGFQRGAFTDAHKDKPGRLEAANGGTLFIDDIQDLSLPVQAKFLHVLEDNVFSRLGGTDDKLIDVRVVVATNLDLPEEVRKGRFRMDLFQRLNVVRIEVPPLRDRREDISLLMDHFLGIYCDKCNRKPLPLTDRVLDRFTEYHWPGNVRQLENIIRRAVVFGSWSYVYKELTTDERAEQPSPAKPKPCLLDWPDSKVAEFFNARDFSLKNITSSYVSTIERQAIKAVLKETIWNRKQAAFKLQVSYKTLLKRIHEFDLRP